jgi:hypothetical protein
LYQIAGGRGGPCRCGEETKTTASRPIGRPLASLAVAFFTPLPPSELGQQRHILRGQQRTASLTPIYGHSICGGHLRRPFAVRPEGTHMLSGTDGRALQRAERVDHSQLRRACGRAACFPPRSPSVSAFSLGRRSTHCKNADKNGSEAIEHSNLAPSSNLYGHGPHNDGACGFVNRCGNRAAPVVKPLLASWARISQSCEGCNNWRATALGAPVATPLPNQIPYKQPRAPRTKRRLPRRQARRSGRWRCSANYRENYGENVPWHQSLSVAKCRSPTLRDRDHQV